MAESQIEQINNKLRTINLIMALLDNAGQFFKVVSLIPSSHNLILEGFIFIYIVKIIRLQVLYCNVIIIR